MPASPRKPLTDSGAQTKKPGLDRRQLIRRSGMATVAGLMAAAGARPLAAAPLGDPSPQVYTRMGAKPFINCTATLTINGGSRQLPQVIEAVEHAAHYHVDLNDLMEAAGKRISELLRVDWALVTSGAAAALSHATAACVAGADPEKMQQLPDMTGLKNEVIIPRSSRNPYDHAVRAVGLKTIEVDSIEEFKAALNQRTALVMILGNRFDKVRVSLEEAAPIARQAGVPVLVDAAADYLIVPNPYLAAGADLVAYSGGKILRGPQTAGLLLGREDLVRAAFANSAPHHAFGRPMKVSKEEIAGMVTAVEVWVNERNLEAEYEEWKGWYKHISDKITQVAGVKTEVQAPSRGGPFPTLQIEWDPQRIGLTAGELHDILIAGDPAIQTHASGGGHAFLLRPVALKPEEYKVVADRLYEVLRSAPKPQAKKTLATPAEDVSGRWDVAVKFALGEAEHLLFLEAHGNQLKGSHIGSRTRGLLEGVIDGDRVRFRSVLPYEGSRLSYIFEGVILGGRMEGQLNLGEYPKAAWTAKRQA
jgi:L-seryl-tRNA(Ser) seleniumtransferase